MLSKQKQEKVNVIKRCQNRPIAFVPFQNYENSFLVELANITDSKYHNRLQEK